MWRLLAIGAGCRPLPSSLIVCRTGSDDTYWGYRAWQRRIFGEGRGRPQRAEIRATTGAQAAIVALLVRPEVFGIQCLRSVCKPFSQCERYYR